MTGTDTPTRREQIEAEIAELYAQSAGPCNEVVLRLKDELAGLGVVLADPGYLLHRDPA